MSFYLFDLLLFPAIVQGVFISIFLIARRSDNKPVNHALALLMISSAFMLIGRMIFDRFPEGWMYQIAFIPDIIILLFGPLSYIFILRLLTGYQSKFIYLHFIPAFLYSAMLIYFFTAGSVVFDQLVATRKIWEVIFYIETSGILSNTVYLILSFILIFRYESGKKHRLSFEQPVFAFLKVYFGGITLGLCLWIFGYVSAYFFNYYDPFINYETIWYSIPMASYIVGYYMIVKPPIFFWKLNTDKIKTIRLPSYQTTALKERLGKAISEDRIYEKDDLTLKELADSVGSSVHNISWLLNEVYHQSFYDFVNKLRVEEFVTKVKQGEHERKTILGLALEVGFKSKSTFNKAFKSVYNLTPSEFIRQPDLRRSDMRYSA